jgi:competence ComEA-like helix-hairpin-helix protein
MRHPLLLSTFIGLLVVAVGGVFVLVSQGGGSLVDRDISKEAFVAGAHTQEGLSSKKDAQTEVQEEKVLEAKVQEEQAHVSVPSPTPLPMAESLSSPMSISLPAEENILESQTSTLEFTPEPMPLPQTAEQPQEPQWPININTANSSELELLSGIGPVLASRIIDYRDNTSLFYGVEDIKNVSGIGDAKFEKIKGDITVGNISPYPQPVLSLTPTLAPFPQTLSASEKININTSSLEELDEITGVGPAIAKRIIDYRTEIGSFQSIEEIKNVKGIGSITFEEMKDEITI